jgi:hypothetical protein
MMNKTAMRLALAKELGCVISDKLWEFLDRRGLVDEHLLYEEAGAEDLARDARLLLDYGCEIAGSRRPPAKEEYRAGDQEIRHITQAERPSRFVLSETEMMRSEAIGTHCAKIACDQPDIRYFRERILGGSLLTRDQAEAFILSPATAYLSADQFRSLGIPIVGHKAEFLGVAPSPHEQPNCHCVRIWVDPPGIEYTATHILYDRPPNMECHPLKYLRYLSVRGDHIHIQAFPCSILGHLDDLCLSLVDKFHFDEVETARFVITDDPPRVLPIKATTRVSDYENYCDRVIEFQVQTWVSPEALLRTYSRRRNEIMGQAYRPVSARNVALFKFVRERESTSKPVPRARPKRDAIMEHIDAALRSLDAKTVTCRPPWQKLLREWNDNYSDRGVHWTYISAKAMARDYHRARKLLIYRTAPA